VANRIGNTVGILLGDGTGHFSQAATVSSGGSGPLSVTVGDFNGDGKLDLAVANFYDNTVGILLGNGSGGFAPAITVPSGGIQPESVTVADFNGDGKEDRKFSITP